MTNDSIILRTQGITLLRKRLGQLCQCGHQQEY